MRSIETGCLFELCAWTSLSIAHLIFSKVVFAEVMFNHRLCTTKTSEGALHRTTGRLVTLLLQMDDGSELNFRCLECFHSLYLLYWCCALDNFISFN